MPPSPSRPRRAREQLHHLGIGPLPGFVPAGVEQLHAHVGPLLGAQVGQLVQRIRGAARTTGRGAGQDQPAHPLGVPDGHLLGHHAPEGDPQDEAVVPTDGVEECGGIVGEVGHGVGPGGHAALPQAALVVGQDLEGGGQGAVQPGLLAQVASGARDAQQPLDRSPASS